jgi:hypothetical protein
MRRRVEITGGETPADVAYEMRASRCRGLSE